jgi:uncharacterized repeat protein (TIGR01451 family)/LPXTG-motif cell wall-anchored protein
MLWATLHVEQAYPDSPALTIELTADSGQDSYQVGARVDFRAKVSCVAATSCGVVTVTVSLDPNLTYESHSVITAVRTGPTTNASVQAATTPSSVTFTIGTDAVGFGSGEYVTFPISARAVSIPADATVKIRAGAVSDRQGTATADLTISTSAGPGPNDATKVSIGGCVWWDADRDGNKDAAESPQTGVGIIVSTASGTRVQATDTDASGCYVITDLAAGGAYQLAITPPDGAVFAQTSTGSVVDANGLLSFTAPASGSNAAAAAAADLPDLNAGLVAYNLELTERLATSGSIEPGDTVRYRLVATNSGTTAALAGWQVRVVLPKKLTLVSLQGSGFDCVRATCTATGPLAAGGTSAPITLTARVASGAAGELSVVAYVRPADGDVAESVPLGTAPGASTDTDATVTDNDDRAVIDIDDSSDSLADTGSRGVWTELTLGAFLVAAGGGLLLTRRRRAAS